MKTIAIQVTNMREEEFLADKQALETLGITPIYFGLIPFSDEIIGAEAFDNFETVIAFGSTKLIRLWQRGLTPKSATVFYDEIRFDQRIHAEVLGEHLLNHQALYSTLGTERHTLMCKPMFVKPSNDLKAFPGMLVERGQTISQALSQSTQDCSLSNEEPILVAPIRQIDREYRSFIVNGKVIDTCVYKRDGRIAWSPATLVEKSSIKAFADGMSALYTPYHSYVMDTARLVDGELTVIEYNCLNCSGKYACNRVAIFDAVRDTSPPRPKGRDFTAQDVKI